MEIRRNNLKTRRGITMIELMITIAIMALLAALVAPSFSLLRGSVALGNATRELQSALRLVQSRAVVAQDGTAHGVYLETDHYFLFADSWSGVGTRVDLPSGIVISGVVGQTITFNRLTGLPSSAQDVVLEAGSDTRMVRVDTSGLISLP